jgi:telomerase reverse transcriptase
MARRTRKRGRGSYRTKSNDAHTSNERISPGNDESPLLLTPIGDTANSVSSASPSEGARVQPQPLPLQHSISLLLNGPVYTLNEFLRNHAPSLNLSTNDSDDNQTSNSTLLKSPLSTNEKSYDSSRSWPPELKRMLLAPLSSCPVAVHFKRAECRESVPSLMDDIVWALVQRQERGKRRWRQQQRHQQRSRKNNKRKRSDMSGNDNNMSNNNKKSADLVENYRNVLIQGYTTAREGETAPRGMRPGVALVSHTLHPKLTTAEDGGDSCYYPRLSVSTFPINEHLAYCKSSSVVQFLHSLVGDEVLRMILMHTRVFLPLHGSPHPPYGNHETVRGDWTETKSDDKSAHGHQNYLLLCGPPLPSICSSNRKSEQTEKKKKKRRRYHVPLNTPAHNGNGSISRFSLLYFDAYVPKLGLPRSHILQNIRQRRLDDNDTRKSNPPEVSVLSPATSDVKKTPGYELMHVMMGLWRENKNKQRRIRKRIGQKGIELCDQIHRGHSKCDYHRLVERYCPLPPAVHGTKNSFQQMSSNGRLSQLAHAYTSKDRIVMFLRKVLEQVFPVYFWGSVVNFDVFMRSVKNFVELRRKERLTNKCLMHGIRITKMEWLMKTGISANGCDTHRSSHEALIKLSLTCFRWVFQGYIIPLLRSVFYVTETEFSGQELQYYRKPVWSLFRSLSVKKLVTGKHFKTLSFKETRSRLRNHKQMGLSRLRLLPKMTGVRPISQLSRKQSLRFLFETPSTNTGNKATTKLNSQFPTESVEAGISFRLPTNIILKKVLDVLRFECSRLCNPFGVGMDSLEMFYPQYRHYITKLRQKYGANMSLYAASVDIEKCYDRINQTNLLDQLNNLISSCAYFIQHVRSDRFYADGKTQNSTDLSAKRRKINFTRVVAPMDTYQPLHEGCRGGFKNTFNAIFDLSKCTMTEQTEIMELLKEHLSNQMVVVSGRFRPKVLLQCTGISQGSVLSTTLCNLYYGQVEKSIFRIKSEVTMVDTTNAQVLEKNEDKDDEEMMSRFVDDFLFLSPCKESVGKFLARSYRGEPHLGAEVNRAKSLASADIPFFLRDTTGRIRQLSAPIYCRKNRLRHNVFPWCGLLFDLRTGEVSMDYARFRGGRLRDSLTVESNGDEGQRLNGRMKSFVLPRCLPILFDVNINSPTTVAVNFHEMMLLSAAKTVEYLRSYSVLLIGSQSNPGFVCRCIQELGIFAWQNIDRNLRLRGRNFPKPTAPKVGKNGFCLRQEQTCWLTWKAFLDVFSESNDFNDLLQLISAMEPTYHKSMNDLPLKQIAVATVDNFQLRHFIT